jgi:hypothetical protein
MLKNANCVTIEVELLKEIAQLESAIDAARDRPVAAATLKRRVAARRLELAVKLERARTGR